MLKAGALDVTESVSGCTWK